MCSVQRLNYKIRPFLKHVKKTYSNLYHNISTISYNQRHSYNSSESVFHTFTKVMSGDDRTAFHAHFKSGTP